MHTRYIQNFEVVESIPMKLLMIKIFLIIASLWNILRSLKWLLNENIARILKRCPENISSVVEVSSCYY